MKQSEKQLQLLMSSKTRPRHPRESVLIIVLFALSLIPVVMFAWLSYKYWTTQIILGSVIALVPAALFGVLSFQVFRRLRKHFCEFILEANRTSFKLTILDRLFNDCRTTRVNFADILGVEHIGPKNNPSLLVRSLHNVCEIPIARLAPEPDRLYALFSSLRIPVITRSYSSMRRGRTADQLNSEELEPGS